MKKRVKYTVYIDEGEYWLRIRHEYSGVSASISVDSMRSLLVHGGKIELDKKKSNVKTLTFDSSNHLYSEDNNIDTFLSNGRDSDHGIDDRGALNNILCAAPEMRTYLTRIEERIEKEFMRKKYERDH